MCKMRARKLASGVWEIKVTPVNGRIRVGRQLQSKGATVSAQWAASGWWAAREGLNGDTGGEIPLTDQTRDNLEESMHQSPLS